jgi:5-methylcytosine-specific restriction endonuclease McrA
MDQYKTCTKCGQTKPKTDFRLRKGKNNNNSYLASTCAVCERLTVSEYGKKNRHKRTLYQRQYRLKNPQVFVNLRKKDYAKNKAKRDAYAAKYRGENPELIRFYAAKRRAKKAENGIFSLSKKDVRRLSQGSCFYCSGNQGLEIDHIIPISRGGRHSFGNLLVACRSCNASKGSKFITEWKKGKNAN